MKLFPSTATTFTKNGLGTLTDAVSCTVRQILNGEYELQMQYPITGIHYDDIALRTIILAKPDKISDEQPFRIYRITKPLNGIVTIYARHIAYDMSGYGVSPFTAATLGLALQGLSSNAVPAGCPFTFNTDKSVNSDFTVAVPKSLWSCLGGSEGSILDTYKGEWEFNKYAATLHNKRGSNRGVTIRYGKNLTSYEQDLNCSNVYTAVYPYWSNGTTTVTLTSKTVAVPGTFDFTRVLTLDLSGSFQEEPTEQQLQAKTEAYIAANEIGVPDVSWKVEFVQLEASEEYKDKAILEQIFLGDTVTIEFEKYNVSATARAVEVEYNVLLGRYDSVTLGKVKTNMADTIAAQQKEIESKPSLTLVEQIASNLADAIMGANGGSVRLLDTNNDGYPDELYIADNVNPTLAVRVWRFNYLGWAASVNGYNGPFVMGATLEDGLLSNAVTAANLTAGTIQSADGQSFYLNLTENVLRMAALNTLESSLQGEISDALDDAKGYTDSEITTNLTPLNALLNYLQVGDLGGGLYGVKIGKIDQATAFKSVFTATALEFYENAVRTAFLSNQKLNCNTIRTAAMELVGSSNMGDTSAVDWLVTLDNGFTIRYVGGN